MNILSKVNKASVYFTKKNEKYKVVLKAEITFSTKVKIIRLHTRSRTKSGALDQLLVKFSKRFFKLRRKLEKQSLTSKTKQKNTERHTKIAV